MKLFKDLLVWFLAGFGLIAILAYVFTDHVEELTARYNVITLSGSTFDLDVKVLITDDIDFAVKYVKENLDSTVKSEDFDARAVTFGTIDGKSPIIWLPHETTVDVINHELLHATVSIMNWAGVPLTDSTEEVYAYELQYLSNQFYKQIKPTK